MILNIVTKFINLNFFLYIFFFECYNISPEGDTMEKNTIAVLFEHKKIADNIWELVPQKTIIGKLVKEKFCDVLITKDKKYYSVSKDDYTLECFGYPISSWEYFNDISIDDNIHDIETTANMYFDLIKENKYYKSDFNKRSRCFYKLKENKTLVMTKILDSYKDFSVDEKIIYDGIGHEEEFDNQSISATIFLDYLGMEPSVIKTIISGKDTDIVSHNYKYINACDFADLNKNINKKIDNDNYLNLGNAYESLNKIIISQDQALKEILLTMKLNYQKMKMNYPVSNILLVGPTGVGKTLIAKEISKKLNVPFVCIDSNNYTQAGYVGETITNCLEQLYIKSNYNKELAEKGIVFIDEIDKLAQNSSTDYIKTLGVQDALLKLLEGQEYNLTIGKEKSAILFDSSKVTFIAAGAFNNITSPKLEKGIGFEKSLVVKNDYHNNINEKLIQYGMKNELIGRFSKIVLLNELKVEDMKKIILSEKSIFNFYVSLFSNYGIKFIYDDSFIDEVARYAYNCFGGARGINKVLENIFADCLWEIYTMNKNYSSLTVNSETVSNPKKYILK